MRVPSGISHSDFSAALDQFSRIVGNDWLFTSDDDVALYRDAYSPLWGEPDELLASAAVAPNSVDQVQSIVKVAARYKIPLFAISTGKNLGYGGSAPNYSGSVIVDLKRMNKVIEVDDKRNFCIVEPGVSYFDLYRYVEERNLKVVVDVPDPGWGSPVGNALEHGVGFMMGMYRDHFGAHCGMEVVLPNGEIMRTGMGAAPESETWAEYKYGYGPYVDGLFAQANFGIVTKMGFWMMPRPEHFFSGRVTVPHYMDIVPLVDGLNYLEDSGLIGHPRYESALQLPANGADPELLQLHAQPGGGSPDQYERYAQAKGIEYWSVVVNCYGSKKTVAAHWEYAKERLAGIKGIGFKDLESFSFPISEGNRAKARHLDSLGIPNMSAFSLGIRSDLMPTPADGHIWFSPVISRTGAALIKAHQVFGEAFKQMGVPSPIGPYSPPRTWSYRAFVFIISFSISRSDRAQNQKVRAVFKQLIKVAASHGWTEYRTAPAFQDLVADTYSYNHSALLRFSQTLKDAVDPDGIISPGRGGIWPKHLRTARR